MLQEFMLEGAELASNGRGAIPLKSNERTAYRLRNKAKYTSLIYLLAISKTIA